MNYRKNGGNALYELWSDKYYHLLRIAFLINAAYQMYQIRTELNGSANFQTLAAPVFYYGLADLFLKFLENFKSSRAFYKRLLKSTLKDLSKEFHKEIKDPNIVFRLKLYLEKKSNTGKLYLESCIVIEDKNINKVKSFISKINIFKKETIWMLDDDNQKVVRNGAAGKAWANVGDLIKAPTSDVEPIEEVLQNEIKLKAFAEAYFMTPSQVKKRHKNKKGSPYEFPSQIFSFAHKTKNGSKFVLVLDNDQEDAKCKITDRNIKKLLGSYSKFIAHILSH